MIFDAFILNDELDMLECRLTELENSVDRHVIVESKTTFQGQPKPLFYCENLTRFKRWDTKISHVIINGQDGVDAWAREDAQRDAITQGLSGASSSDLVLLSDIDEIPSTYAVAKASLSAEEFLLFDQTFHSFAVDWLHPAGHWYGTSAARISDISSNFGLLFSKMRKERGSFSLISNGGWHFSWLGGISANLSKLASFSHTELTHLNEDLVRCSVEGYHVDGAKLVPVDVDNSWPVYIREQRCPQTWFRRKTLINAISGY